MTRDLPSTPDALPLVSIRTGAILFALIALALAARLYGLSADAVWFDEAATIEIADLPLADLTGEMARLESSPPGYYLIARQWIKLIGDGIAGLRFVSTLAGVLTIVPIWYFAHTAFGERAGLLVATLVAVTSTLIRFSQDARTYAILFLLFSCAMVVALRLARTQVSRRELAFDIVALGLLQAGMLWLHATASVQLLAIGVFVLVCRVVNGGRFWATAAIVAGAGVISLVVAYVPVCSVVLHLLQPEFSDRWINRPDVIEALRVYGRTLVAPFQYGLSPVAAALAVGFSALAAFEGMRRLDGVTFGLVAMLAALGTLLPVLSNVVPILLDRTILFMWMPLQVLVAAGAARLPGLIFYAAAAALVGLQVVGMINYARLDPRKEKWPEAVALMPGGLGPDQPILVTEGAFAGRALAIALRDRGETARIVVVPPASEMERFVAAKGKREVVLNPSILCPTVAGATTVWVVTRELPPEVASDDGYSAKPAILAALATAGSRLLSTASVPGVVIERWSAPRCP
jgi:mannosyltransferase